MNKSIHRFSLFTAGATWVLLFAGGLVTSTGSGLAVPDWPLSFGTLFPPMVGGVLFEHGHRMIAGTVALLTLALMVWVLRRETRGWVKGIAVAAFAAVVLQAVLGGITVLMKLPTGVSVSHACLGQLFFCLVVTLALVTSPAWVETQKGKRRKEGTGLRFLSIFLFVIVFIQLVLGALMRHTGAGLAIPDFPLSYGQWIPPLNAQSVQIHFAHRVGALCVFLVSAWVIFHIFRNHRNQLLLTWPTVILGVLVSSQITLGAFTIWTMKAVPIVTLHVAVGALVLATSLIILLRTFRYFPRHCEAAKRPKQSLWANYTALAKIRVSSLVVFSTGMGYVLGAGEMFSSIKLFWTLLGTFLVSSGANALNQYLERKIDGRMQRTQKRPLPTGRLKPYEALYFSVLVSSVGLLILVWGAHGLAGLLALITLASYCFLYTPLKTRTSLCTLVGAVPGAIPPMIGWAAATGTLGLGAWALFAILFVWQIPHFLAIAWMYRDQYKKAGFKMLTLTDANGRSTSRQILIWCVALVPVSLIPTLIGISGTTYFFGALILGLIFLGSGFTLAKLMTRVRARRVLLVSVAYLPIILILMVFG